MLQLVGIATAGFPIVNEQVTALGTQTPVPAGETWKLYAIYVVLTTSSIAGNRISQVKVIDGVNGHIMRAVTWPGSTAASLVKTLNTVAGAVGQSVNLGSTRVDVTTVMEPFWVPSGYQLIYNDDAAVDPTGDKLNIVFLYERWLDVPAPAVPVSVQQPLLVRRVP